MLICILSHLIMNSECSTNSLLADIIIKIFIEISYQHLKKLSSQDFKLKSID